MPPASIRGVLTMPDGAQMAYMILGPGPAWLAEDQVISREIQAKMGQLIPNSRTVLHSSYGQGNDQENPAYEAELAMFVASIDHMRLSA